MVHLLNYRVVILVMGLAGGLELELFTEYILIGYLLCLHSPMTGIPLYLSDDKMRVQRHALSRSHMRDIYSSGQAQVQVKLK